MVIQKRIIINTISKEIYDITEEINNAVRNTKIQKGIVNIFIPGSTGAISTTEYEDGAISDIKDFLEKYIPSDIYYKHNDTWHDDNGFSHLRSTILKTSLTVPFDEQRLVLGSWQQIIFIECDNRNRKREIIVTIIGE